jgi:hypothetical protein
MKIAARQFVDNAPKNRNTPVRNRRSLSRASATGLPFSREKVCGLSGMVFKNVRAGKKQLSSLCAISPAPVGHKCLAGGRDCRMHLFRATALNNRDHLSSSGVLYREPVVVIVR